MLVAKTKVAPVKTQSVARTIVVNEETFAWTGSTIVLADNKILLILHLEESTLTR